MSSKKGVLQECHLSVSRQGVPQVGSLENVIISENKYFLFFNMRVGIRVRGFHLVFLLFGKSTVGSACLKFAKVCVRLLHAGCCEYQSGQGHSHGWR